MQTQVRYRQAVVIVGICVILTFNRNCSRGQMRSMDVKELEAEKDAILHSFYVTSLTSKQSIYRLCPIYLRCLIISSYFSFFV